MPSTAFLKGASRQLQEYLRPVHQQLDPTELAGKTGDDNRNEFLNIEAVFFQNGSWGYTNLVGDGKPLHR